MTNKVFAKAIRLLSIRDHSIRDLREKLSRAFPDSQDKESIETAIEELKQLGYLDDSKYAVLLGRKYYRKCHSRDSISRILKYELNVSLDTDLWAKITDGLQADYAHKLNELMTKHSDTEGQDFRSNMKAKSKLFRKLSSLGHSAQTVQKIISEHPTE